MKQIPETIMEQRRLERLRQLEFFMRDERVPPNAKRMLSLGACHNLLTGFFSNSHWATAWYCVKQAADHTWQTFKIDCRLRWHYKVMRRTHDEVEAIFERET